MRSMPALLAINDAMAFTCLKTRAVIKDHLSILDFATRSSSDFSFELNKNLLVDWITLTARRQGRR